MNSKKTALVLVAGGSGTRMGGKLPKQYMKINGREIIEHTLSTFHDSGMFDKIVIVCAKPYMAHVTSLLQSFKSEIPVVITESGETRQASVFNGLKKVSDCHYVMIHDAVRCCITVDEIKRLAKVLTQDKACALGLKVKDTIKLSNDDNTILNTLNRDNLWHIQTPQAFVTSEIIGAHNLAMQQNFNATDDCAIAENAGICVTIVEGSDTNLKITTPFDLVVASEILKARA